MCNTCGCDQKESKTVAVHQSLLKANEETAADNRRHFEEKDIFVVNLISSPGSGKTTLLEKTIDVLKDEISIGVLEGDIETELDAERIRAKGVPAVQLTTGGACHLEASLIHKGFHSLEHQLEGKKLDILFIENVGNLVCPSFFDLGEQVRVVLISVPEGHDKPLKYPKAIRTSQVLVLSKCDLIDHFDFDIDKTKQDALAMNPSLKIFVTSATTGEGIDQWVEFLRSKLTSGFKESRGEGGE
ncbi:MAG: hydrogenase expression protein HypC [Nitrospira bacterium SG8_35_1]|nr:MAG: hydrogenase expression protein HypC [Nitrospira bacterium SG8_35_1]